MSKQSNTRGFTLIELLITVAILSILAALVIPSYNGQTAKARRTDAKIALKKAAVEMERCYVLHNQYDHNSCASYPASGNNIVISDEGYYKIVATNLTHTTFTLTASPSNNSPQNSDTHCQDFTINSLGEEGATNSDCW